MRARRVRRAFDGHGRALALTAGLALASCSPKAEPPAGSQGRAPTDVAGNAPAPVGGDAAPRTHLHVLFVGNSYTFVNDVPGLVTRIAATAGSGPKIDTEAATVGSATLGLHWTNGVAGARIAEKTWSHVVLQGQSQEAIGGNPTDFWDYAQRFGDLATNAGARPTWFVTWARGRAAFPADDPNIDTRISRMQDEITYAYAEAMRRVPGSLLACVGEAFRTVVVMHPEIALHVEDGSHATLAGSYLAAATIYVALTGAPVPLPSAVPDGLDPLTTATLRDAARVGSACADVRIYGDPALTGESFWLGSGPTGPLPLGPGDFGVAARPVTRAFMLSNWGHVAMGVADGATLAAPFAWTNGAYPGGAGSDPATGSPFCGSTLLPTESCRVSVTYAGDASHAGTMTLRLSNAYAPKVSASLQGTTTDRGSLALRAATAPLPVQARQGESADVVILVTNQGARRATALTADAPPAPFTWGGPGMFPGDTMASHVADATYAPCGESLAAGETCALTLRFSPPDSGTNYDATWRLAFSSAPAADAPAVRDAAFARLAGYSVPNLPGVIVR